MRRLDKHTNEEALGLLYKSFPFFDEIGHNDRKEGDGNEIKNNKKISEDKRLLDNKWQSNQ